jgi:hypothetical protein
MEYCKLTEAFRGTWYRSSFLHKGKGSCLFEYDEHTPSGMFEL